MPKSTTTTAAYKTVRQPKTPANQVEKCLVPGCKNQPLTSGLCARCYSGATKLMRNEEASREQLEEMGLIAKKKPPMQKNPLVAAFRAMQANQKKAR